MTEMPTLIRQVHASLDAAEAAFAPLARAMNAATFTAAATFRPMADAWRRVLGGALQGAGETS